MAAKAKTEQIEVKKEYTLSELLDLEKASTIIINKLERTCRNYDNTIRDKESIDKFNKYNKVHEDVILKIMKKLDEYEY